MTQSLLARHPTPFPTESLPGHILRLSEANGYSTPRKMFLAAGMNGDEISVRSFNCEKMAAITNRSTEELERIGMRPMQKDSWGLRLLGNTVGLDYLDIRRAKVCPACIIEDKFIEAHWQLSFMVACPVHEQPAVFFCSQCKKTLSWLRPGLLQCKCGAEWKPRSIATVPNPELLRLLDLIRCKVLGSTRVRHYESALECQFMPMSLQAILSMVRLLGKARLTADRSKESRPWQIVGAAATVLHDWPSNFHKLLDDLSPSLAMKIALPQMEDYAGIAGLIQQKIDERFRPRKFETSPPHPMG